MTTPFLADHEFWILHAPYPDQSWRGLEKCPALTLNADLQPKPVRSECTGEDYEVPLLFTEEEGAWAFLRKHDIIGVVPVRVLLVTPFVRRPLDAIPRSIEVLPIPDVVDPEDEIPEPDDAYGDPHQPSHSPTEEQP